MNRRLILALAPVTLALAGSAYAQPAGAPPMMRHQATPEMRAQHEALMRQHVEDLKIVLRLRPDQEAALQALVAAHQPTERGAMRGPPDERPRTTPERLDQMAKREAEMAAQHAKMRDALGKFYASLNPEQQKAFDALQRLQRHGGGMRGGRGQGMMMMRHMGPGGAPTPGGEPD